MNMSLRLAACVVLFLAATAHGQVDAAKPSSHDELFGIDKIWDLHIAVPYNGWTSMRPDSKGKIGYDASFPYAKARVRLLEDRGQPLDHPVLLELPESRYLKGLLVQAADPPASRSRSRNSPADR